MSLRLPADFPVSGSVGNSAGRGGGEGKMSGSAFFFGLGSVCFRDNAVVFDQLDDLGGQERAFEHVDFVDVAFEIRGFSADGEGFCTAFGFCS